MVNFNKIAVISFVVVALGLTITGIYFLLNPAEEGTQNQNQNQKDCEIHSIPCDGLVGWYNSSSFSPAKGWEDLSGLNNTLTIGGGLPKVESGKNYVQGASDDFILFPKGTLVKDYTLIHVTKYNGPVKGRIFQGMGVNWLSGHHAGAKGTSYQEGWISRGSGQDVQSFTLSIDQQSTFRYDNSEIETNAEANTIPAEISINYGHSQPSDWAVGEILVYNRHLTEDEIKSIKSYLRDKFNLAIHL